MKTFNSVVASIDVSRNAVLRVDQVEHFIDLAAKMGYTAVTLYTEDLYEMPEYPLFGYQRGKYSKDDLKHLVAYGKQRGITLFPSIEVLAHLQHIFRWDEFIKYRDTDDILLVDDDRTYRLIECMMKTCREIFDTDQMFMCCDEAEMLGRGKFLNKNGYEDAGSIFSRHVNRCIDMAHTYGFTPILDHDMFFTYVAGSSRVTDASAFYDKIPDDLPENVVMAYWDYAPSPQRMETMLEACSRYGRPLAFVTSVMNWSGLAPHNQLAIERMDIALSACAQSAVDQIIVSFWGDDGGECSVFSCLPSWFYAAQVCRGITDLNEIKANFKNLFGIEFDDFNKLDNATDYLGGEPQYFSEKPMIFNDPFMGIYDIHVPKDIEASRARFRGYADELHALADAPEFGYLFDTHAALCDLMSVKMDLGIRARAAYEARDTEALRALAEDFGRATDLAETFYAKFRDLWLRERKANGFEVQTIRYGGLIQRLRDCRLRLIDLLDGRIDRIEELEEPIVQNGTGAGLLDKKYGQIVSVNSLTPYNFYGF